MKKILLLFIFLISMSASSQTIPKITFKEYNLIMSDKNECYFKVENDSIMTVKDSLKTIKNLYKLVIENQKRGEVLHEAIDNSVDFINTIPDIYKKGYKWESYVNSIKKQGYSISKKRKK